MATTRDIPIRITDYAADYPRADTLIPARRLLPIDAVLTEAEVPGHGWIAAAIYVDDVEIQSAGLTWERAE